VDKVFVDSDTKFNNAIKDLSKYQVLSGDTETEGFDPYTKELWSIQLGTPDSAYLFPVGYLKKQHKERLAKLIESVTIIFHNAKFDAKFLRLNGFPVTSVWCTHEAERIIYAGKYFNFSLKDLMKRYFNIEMSKVEREDFYNGEFRARVKKHGYIKAWTPELIEYALNDITNLHRIMERQQKISVEYGLEYILDIECRLVLAIEAMELRGVWLDKRAVKKFESKVNVRLKELELSVSQQLEKSYGIRYMREHSEKMKLWDAWKVEHEKIKLANNERDPENKRRKLQSSKDAIEKSNEKKPFASPPKSEYEFNIGSHKQLKMALEEHLGMPLSTTNKEWMEDSINLHPMIAELLEWRKYQKLGQFCQMIDEINPVTGMIHADFKQNGTQSGRQSCANPNLQQIPSKTDEAKQFRALFKARKGYSFVGADYAGIELVIIANYSNETILIDSINRGDDIHCFTMSHMMSCPYDILVKLKKKQMLNEEDLEVFRKARKKFESLFYMPELIMKDSHIDWVNTFRDYVKTLSYGLVYGLTAFGLSKKFHCEYMVAESFINNFFGVYRNIKRFLNKIEEESYQRRYALNPLGRRRWFSYPRRSSIEDIEKKVMKKLDEEKRLWDSVPDTEWNMLMDEAVKQDEKEFQGKIRSIKRQAGNFFPQSLCAEMIKISTTLFHEEWSKVKSRKTGLILSVHDELIGEFKESEVDKAKQLLEKIMTESAKRFLDKTKVNVEAKVMNVWEK